jgi:hypothetical protein
MAHLIPGEPPRGRLAGIDLIILLLQIAENVCCQSGETRITTKALEQRDLGPDTAALAAFSAMLSPQLGST